MVWLKIFCFEWMNSKNEQMAIRGEETVKRLSETGLNLFMVTQ